MSTYTYMELTEQVQAYIIQQQTVGRQLSEPDRGFFEAKAFGAYSFWFALTCAEDGEKHLENVRRLRALATPLR